ncbi:TPA: Fic family protein [Bacillus cereus]|uniref:Fic family protein n=1 Tax=Bacillus cereus group sp. FL70 TaxID=3040254 RepID=UPI0033023082|nr:Fic family protein [Bacillus cereus]
MKFFGKSFLHMPFHMEMVRMLGKIHHDQGQLTVYEKEFPLLFQKVHQSTRDRQVKHFMNMYQGMKLSNIKLKTLLAQDRFPQNMMEEEVTCYYDAFTLIHDQYETLSISVETILEIHFQLFKYATSDSGTFRQQDIVCHGYSHKSIPISYHHALPAKDIAYFLEKLCTEYNQIILTRNVDPVLSVINFIFHFICIVPFDKGNGRMVRLLFSLLLVKENHSIVKYISLDAIIKQWENAYYEAVYKSAANWFSEEYNLLFITDCLLRIIHAAYEELQKTLLPYQIRGKQRLQLSNYMLKQKGAFSKEDIRKIFPTVSESTLQRTFQCLQQQKKIKLLSKGRAAKWSIISEEMCKTT